MQTGWIYAGLPLVLTVLKILAVIGAFYGLSEEKGGRRKRTIPVSPVAFLFIAVMAEVTDAVIKRKDDRETALQFERLARPLGAIKVDARYAIKITDARLAAYRQRLAAWGHGSQQTFPLPPDAWDPANLILSFTPGVTLFFYREAVPAGATLERDPDLSFSVRSGPEQWRWTSPQQSDAAVDFFNRRQFSFSNDILSFSVEEWNAPLDRYSNGRISSVVDLPGSQLVAEVCLPKMVNPSSGPTPPWPDSVTLEDLSIEFPGRQSFTIYGHDIVSHKGENDCIFYYYKIPNIAFAPD